MNIFPHALVTTLWILSNGLQFIVEKNSILPVTNFLCFDI